MVWIAPWNSFTTQSDCWTLHFTILLLRVISNAISCWKHSPSPVVPKEPWHVQDWDLEGVSFAGPQCWWAQALPAHLAVAHRGRGKHNLLFLQVESYALQPAFVDSQTFGCQDAWFQEQTDTVSTFGTLPLGKVPQLKIHHPSLAAPVSCPFLVTLQQRRWKLSRVIGNCIPMRKRHSSHAFRLKSGKQWKTGKEWDRWMMIDDGSCVTCKLQTISEETRETRCWGDEVRVDLCSFILEERWIFFTWIEPDLSSTCRELIQQLKHSGGLQQF